MGSQYQIYGIPKCGYIPVFTIATLVIKALRMLWIADNRLTELEATFNDRDPPVMTQGL
jgi:hypothetical protein